MNFEVKMAIKLNSFIDIVSTVPTKDHEGFVTKNDSVVANVRAYFETKNSTEKWRNNAIFEEATALFRFRVIPKIKIDSTMIIICDNERYNIISAEDVQQRGRYIECFGKKAEGSS
jgi:SPP1 family predicted phage head-tail adaptor